MVLVRDRRPEQREYAVSRGLRYVALVATNRIHHQLEGRIDDSARLFGVEVLINSIEPLMSANSAVTVLRSPSIASDAESLSPATLICDPKREPAA